MSRPIINVHQQSAVCRPIINVHQQSAVCRPIINVHQQSAVCRPIINVHQQSVVCRPIINVHQQPAVCRPIIHVHQQSAVCRPIHFSCMQEVNPCMPAFRENGIKRRSRYRCTGFYCTRKRTEGSVAYSTNLGTCYHILFGQNV